MGELNLAFNGYVQEFKKLSINEKRVEIIESVKEISALIDMLAEREKKN